MAKRFISNSKTRTVQSYCPPFCSLNSTVPLSFAHICQLKCAKIAYQTWGKMQETAAWMRAFFIIPFARLCMPGKGNAAGKCLPACDLLMGASLYSNNSFRRMQRCGGLYGVSIREEQKEGKRITLRRETGPGSSRRTWRWNKVFEQDDRIGKEK